MSTLDAPPEVTATEPVARRPRTTLLLLRIVLSLHAVAALAQPVLIGQYLDGDFDFLDWHAVNANVVVLLAMAQMAIAILYWRPAGGRGWPALVSVAVFLAEGMQIGVGFSRDLGIHIPLGVAVVAGVVGMTVWAFLPVAGRARPRRRRSGA